MRYSTMGVEFTAVVLLLSWAGWQLDGVLGLRRRFPLFLLVGLFGGTALGIYRMARRLDSENQFRKSERRDPPDDHS